jgi:hypothetical protein
MATSDPKALCGAKASTTGKPCTRTAGWGTGHPGTGRCKFHGGPPALHIWIAARHQAMDRLVDYSKIAIAAGIEERRVKLAEQQGALLAQAIRGILAELGVGDRPEVPAVVRRHLTLIAGHAA